MNDVAVILQDAIGRDQILRLEHAVGQVEQIDMPVKHYFARGIYARELFIPKGTVLVGKIHNYSQINIVSKGDISVTTDDGVKRVQAPFTIASPAGTKRAGYAHEDTIWTTISHSFETDPEKLESELIAPSFEAYELFCKAVAQIEGER